MNSVDALSAMKVKLNSQWEGLILSPRNSKKIQEYPRNGIIIIQGCAREKLLEEQIREDPEYTYKIVERYEDAILRDNRREF